MKNPIWGYRRVDNETQRRGQVLDAVRARTSPTLSDSFSYPFQTLAHLRCSFTTTPRFPRSLSHLSPSPISAYRPYPFLISTVSPFGFLLFSADPLSFPRFPRAQPRYRTVTSVPSYLISDRRRSHARRTACVPWEPFAPLFPRLLHFSHGP